LKADFAGRLIGWQRGAGRHGLPWQDTRDAYRVWLSEVMLQQTQVGTVLDYYPRFVQRFPDVRSLAAAAQDDVLALWSGLGYYSRARNLHRCAQVVVADHGGEFPRSSAELAKLPGIGRSTAAAIAAFCFGERAAILDGNVKRVLTRVHGFDGDLSLAVNEKRLWQIADGLLPERDVGIYTQGLMDLGATVCTLRRPACASCPFKADCIARAAGTQPDYPVKTRRLARGKRENALLWLRQGSRQYLVQRPQQGVWAGLWTLPEYPSAAALHEQAQWPGHGEWMAPIQHTLTHFDWTLHTLVWTLPQRAEPPAALPQGRWLDNAEALALGLPAPVRRLLSEQADQASRHGSCLPGRQRTAPWG
jgi:A/G-specific adenine glycosylase